MRFFIGLHQPSDAQYFDSCMISVNRLYKRKGPFTVGDWILDSGAFTQVARNGGYRNSVADYAQAIVRVKGNGNLLAAVAQDYMCEPFVLKKTGLTVQQHQELTIERYVELVLAETGAFIMAVIQGYEPHEYVRHVRMYDDFLEHGQWVGVGSICKRNGNPEAIANILWMIKRYRPDLKLHGFGLKTIALASPVVRSYLHSADSMAWSFAARVEGRGPMANDWREAKRFERRILRLCETDNGTK